jgi:hypothetical protein
MKVGDLVRVYDFTRKARRLLTTHHQVDRHVLGMVTAKHKHSYYGVWIPQWRHEELYPDTRLSLVASCKEGVSMV